MLTLFAAALVAFAEPLTAAETPKITIEEWAPEEYLYYSNNRLPRLPVDPAGTQMFTIPTARTLAPKTVRVANSMLVYSQANVGLLENLQAGVGSAFLLGVLGDLKYRFAEWGSWSAAAQGGGGYVLINKSSFAFGRLLATFERSGYRLSGAITYAGGEYRPGLLLYSMPRGVQLGGASLGADVRIDNNILLMVESNWTGTLADLREGEALYVVAGPRVHGKQVALDLGLVILDLRDGARHRYGIFPWVGLSWLDR